MFDFKEITGTVTTIVDVQRKLNRITKNIVNARELKRLYERVDRFSLGLEIVVEYGHKDLLDLAKTMSFMDDELAKNLDETKKRTILSRLKNAVHDCFSCLAFFSSKGISFYDVDEEELSKMLEFAETELEKLEKK